MTDGQKRMADWYPLISDAIAALDTKTSEGRRVFYDRARAALSDSLRRADPPLSEKFIEDERMALGQKLQTPPTCALSPPIFEGTSPLTS
jgi:hypothetical protein